MAKGKYEYWLTHEGLVLLEGWARDGLTQDQIAKNMGVSLSTLKIYLKNHLPIMTALKKGKEVADYEVENVLYAKAMSGDTTAIIFWLKNRKPKKWRDRPLEDQDDAFAAIRALVKSNEEAAKIAVQQEAGRGNTER